MELQPTLKSELVLIRPLSHKDKEGLYAVARDPKIWEQHPCKRYLRPEFEKYFAESMDSEGALAIVDPATGRIIGSSRFKLPGGLPDAVEIGWSFLGRKYWGGKYNREVKNLMTDHAFKFVSQVLFFIDKDNIRSRKAVEKINGRQVRAADLDLIPTIGANTLIYVLERPQEYTHT